MNRELLEAREALNTCLAELKADNRPTELITRLIWIAEALEPGAAEPLKQRAIKGISTDMAAVEVFPDPADSSWSTREPTPRTSLIEVVGQDGTELIFREEDLPNEVGLTWDGKELTFEAIGNMTLGFPVFVKSRNGNTQIVNMSTSGFAGLTVKTFWLHYAQLNFISYFFGGLYSENIFYKKLRVIEGAVRSWLGRWAAGKHIPHLAVDEFPAGGKTVPGDGNQMFWVDLLIPENFGAGTPSGEIRYIDVNGDQATLPVNITVKNANAPHDNAKPNMWYVSDQVGRRATGIADTSKVLTQAEKDLLEDWHDAAFVTLREHGIDPVTKDSLDAQGQQTPVPSARHIERLKGTIFNGFRGAKALTATWIAAYNDVNGWAGIDHENGSLEDNRVAARTNIDAMNASYAANGISLDFIFAYTRDEIGHVAAEEVAYWFDPDNTNVLPLITSQTDTDAPDGHLVEEAIAEAPHLRAFAFFGHVYPKLLRNIVERKAVFDDYIDPDQREADLAIDPDDPNAGLVQNRPVDHPLHPDALWGGYNGGQPARAPILDEERPLAHIFSPIQDISSGTQFWFGWEACYSDAFEVSAVDGTPFDEWRPTTNPAFPRDGEAVAGQKNPKRQNLWDFLHTFGNLRALVGEEKLHFTGRGNSANRACNGDGVAIVPRQDSFYSDNALQSSGIGFHPKLKLKSFRRGFQDEAIYKACFAKDPVAAQAAYDALGVKTVWDLGAGNDGNGGIPVDGQSRFGGIRSYLNASIVYRPSDEITSDMLVTFERACYTIMEA